MSPLYSTSSANLVLRPSSDAMASLSPAYRLTSKPAEMPYLIHWLQSGGNLDFMVLALCSCVLTVLCHQPTVSPGTTASSPTATQPTEIDFAIKAGLLTQFPKVATPKLRSDDPDGSD